MQTTKTNFITQHEAAKSKACSATAFKTAAAAVVAATAHGATTAFLTHHTSSASSTARSPPKRLRQASEALLAPAVRAGSFVGLGLGAAASVAMAAVMRGQSRSRDSLREVCRVSTPRTSLRAESTEALPDPVDYGSADPEEYTLTASSLSMAPDVTFMLKETPSRGSSALVIQHRLVSESHYQAVLKLAEHSLPKFDIYNLATALFTCAENAKNDELIARQIQSDKNFIKLFSQTKKKTLEMMQELDAQTMATVLWACARLNIFDSELTSAITADATQRMRYYSPKAIGLLVFALGYSGIRPRPNFIKALVTELMGRTDFTFEDLNLVVYGCMRLGISDRRIMEKASDIIVRTKLDGADVVTLANLTYAYAKLEYWDKTVFGVLGQRIIEVVDEFDPQGFSMCSLGFAAAAAHQEDAYGCMEQIKAAVEGRLQDFSHRDISTLSFAFGKFANLNKKRLDSAEDSRAGRAFFRGYVDKKQEPIVKAIKDEVIRRTHDSFTMQELNLIVYALMRLDNRDDEFLEKAAKLFRRNASELMTIEVVNVLYAFALSNYLSLELVEAMINEIERREMWKDWTPLEAAVVSYSLAFARIRKEDLMDKIAMQLCEKVREFSPSMTAMTIWGVSVLNCRNNGAQMISAVIEEIAKNPSKYDPSAITQCIFGAAILSGPSSALWIFKIWFQTNFATSDFNDQAYSMLHHMMASVQAELGLPMKDVGLARVARTIYEESAAEMASEQHRTLSERLRIQQIPHSFNTVPPLIEGFPEATLVVDIAIPMLKLVIEVEGPQRNVIPFDKLMEKMKESRQDERQERVTISATDPIEAMSQAREYVECGVTGPAAFKRRILRKCGWRVVTVSFDESEEYIADALKKMIDKKQKTASEEAESQQLPEVFKEDSTVEVPEDFDPPAQSDVSAFEVKLRERHEQTMEELRLRIAEERGNVASASTFANHFEYRQWQVDLEKKLLKEMVADVVPTA
eukprot:CAMPEP_0197689176 /NCGR_PEP_ID=MMETSP1338-20131121/106471_1 /TAXON_ID=43686 ORGANISM="Pelagodinium beii, Strain RCC1491" /NCGR_SAMPLE_ID=MMETSP1338 /ASSEMBLY_ACC=CAM_ASM_000754 /LENGTH=975 /DNA_ID=CAMNT_0043271485 /DNA_START=1 /DNA_END=2926 /DNA_ORIENTATION=-